MAESWGGGSPTRCYFVYSTSATDSVYTISIYGYIYLAPSHSSSGAWPRYWSGWWGSGSRSDTFNLNINGGGTTSLIASGGYNISRAFGANGSAAFAISGSTYWGSASHSINFTIPARPYLAPRPPQAVNAARVSDTNATVNWTIDADASNQAQPWTGVYIDRWSVTTNTWTRVATITTTGTSWTDTGITANNKYKYRLSSYNASGQSSWVETGEISTTPTAPIGMTAIKVGVDIDVSWTNTAPHQTATEIYDNGVLVHTLSGNGTTWRHVAPNAAVTHTYTTKAVVSSPTLTSSFSTPSDTVQLQAPPNAPTNVAMGFPVYSYDSGGNGEPLLYWKHNPVDSSIQRKYQIRLRKAGESVWETLTEKTTSRESSDTGELVIVLDMNWSYSPGQYEIQVRTWGSHATAGPYSATATFQIESDPQVTILSPDPNEVVGYSQIDLEWSYSQLQGRAQQSYLIEVLEGGQVVHTQAASSTDTLVPLTYTFQDSKAYQLILTVTAVNGLFVESAPLDITISYLKPTAPIIDGFFDGEGGFNSIDVSNDHDPIPVLFNRVYRNINQDSNWYNVPNNSLPPESIINYENTLYGDTVDVEIDRGGIILDDDPDFVVDGTKLIGQHPVGITDYSCISVIHTDQAGLRSLRQIPTADPSGYADSYSAITIPVSLRGGAQARATLVVNEPMTGNLEARARKAIVYWPENSSSQPDNQAGETPITIEFGNLTDQYTLRLYNGGVEGSGDTYWKDIALFPSGYEGDTFTQLGSGEENGYPFTIDWYEEGGNTYVVKNYRMPDIIPSEWVLVGEFEPNFTWLDYEGTTAGKTMYRVEAVTEIPSVAESFFAVEAYSFYTWLGRGNAFQEVAAMPFNFEVNDTPGVEDSERHYFDGREWPVLVSGTNKHRTLEVTGTLDPELARGHQWKDFVNLALQPGPYLYRDRDGLVIYCDLEGLAGQRSRTGKPKRNITFQVIEVDNE